MATSHDNSPSSLLLIGEPGDELQRYLRAQVPSSAHWQVRSCPSVEVAVGLGPHETPNLVVFVCPQEDVRLCFPLHRLLEHAKRHWPYTFFIVVSPRPLQHLEALFERFGEMPVVDLSAAPTLRAVIEQEMTSATYGLVRGVSLPGFLQMLSWERKSLSIRVEAQEGWGRLHLLRGRLVQAYSDASRQQGEGAALDLLAWDAVSLRIERSYHNGGGSEMRDLPQLLMDAMKKRDEDARQDLLFEDELDELDAHPVFAAGLWASRAAAASWSPLDFGRLTQAPLPGGARHRLEPPGSNVRETLRTAVSEIGGALCAALVDYDIGMALETEGTGLDFDVAAAAHTEVVRANLYGMERLGVPDALEDLVITLRDQYHIISVIPDQPLFLSLTLCRRRGDPAVARATLRALGRQLIVA